MSEFEIETEDDSCGRIFDGSNHWCRRVEFSAQKCVLSFLFQ